MTTHQIITQQTITPDHENMQSMHAHELEFID
jgi:hypothetical protein